MSEQSDFSALREAYLSRQNEAETSERTRRETINSILGTIVTLAQYHRSQRTSGAPWRVPATVESSYLKGEVVELQGTQWESTKDFNVFRPGGTQGGWVQKA